MQRLGTYSVGAARGEDRLWRVFDGTDAFGRPVVIKIVHPHLIAAESIRAALVAGMRTLVAVNHPNVVRHLDVIDDATACALVLAPIEGETLRDRLGRLHRLAPAEALSVAMQIASGLAAAHAASPPVMHGGLEPDHVVLAPEGAKLADFDFTWTVKDAQGESTAGFRNLRYMSPEAIDAAGVEPRSDLYCLGLVLYEMLVGKPPFTAMAPLELLNAQCTKLPPPLPEALRSELPHGLEPLVLRLLEKRREDRPGSAAEVVRLLDGIARGRPEPSVFGPTSRAHGPATTADTAAVPTRSGSSSASVVLAVGLVAVLGAGGGTALLVFGDAETPEVAQDQPTPTTPTTPRPEPVEPDSPRPEPQPRPDPETPGSDSEDDGEVSFGFGINPEALPPEAGPSQPLGETPKPAPPEDPPPPAQGDPDDGESVIAGVVEQLAQTQASRPTREAKIAAWVAGPLTGHDNRVAAFRTVDVKKKGSGHTIFIKNQFQWTCDLEFDDTGSPSKLRNCVSGDPPWNTKTNPIALTCTTDETKEICRGKYKLGSGNFTSTETMQIVRRLPGKK